MQTAEFGAQPWLARGKQRKRTYTYKAAAARGVGQARRRQTCEASSVKAAGSPITPREG